MEYCCFLILPPFFPSRIHSITLSFHRKRVPVAAVPVEDEEGLSPDEENMISASEDEVTASSNMHH